ncbi:receptor-like protein 20 isoform X1 [Populus alba x Populus x berolinensis]|nr:receptor-like protein 20 isoform X1 [Populus alba x Populus x berolinensis]KAJ6865662.1 receptor-like protein 20 isoform X1 [Populus alba x Populus x berolinensis]
MASPVCFLTMRMLLLFLLSLFHLRACYSSPSMQPLCHDDESYALLQFKESLVINESASYEPSANSKVASWKVDGESGDCCSWDGVECDGDSGHVIGLDLSSSCLYGSIDSNSSLFHLVQLRRLNLADNDFNNSEITSEIRNLSRLFDLNLSMSVFSGVIPSSLGNLTKLNYLDLCDNNFTSGTLHWLCNLTKLNCVGLAGTNSYGEIPSCLGNLTQLTELKLDSNELTGQIPTWIGNRTQLITLALGDNKLHGPISDSIFRLPNLESLHLLENLFSGTVELGLLKSRSLVSFQLSDNNLSVIGNHNDSAALQKIQILSLSGCNLSGEFPSFLHGQNHLELGNLLTGFEQSVDILPWNNLRYLRLSFNKLDGALPIPPHSTIIYLVSDNRLNGEIPPAICNLTSLVILQLSNNNLSGKLPQCLGNISNSASVLDLHNNSFSGDIPEAFSSDCALRAIDFSQNQLEGKIPKSLANCPKLEILNIEQNKINDVFPSWLGILPELRVLILRSNRLHGVIGKPKADFEFQRLQIVDLSGNCFFGKLPLEYFRNWTAMKTIYTEHPLYMQVDASFQLPRYVMTYHFDYSMTMTYHP